MTQPLPKTSLPLPEATAIARRALEPWTLPPQAAVNGVARIVRHPCEAALALALCDVWAEGYANGYRDAEECHKQALSCGDLTYDRLTCICTIGEWKVEITSNRERELLWYFLSNQGRVVTREQIGERVWKWEGIGATSNVIDVYVSALRGAIGPDWIRCFKNVGYMFTDRSQPRLPDSIDQAKRTPAEAR